MSIIDRAKQALGERVVVPEAPGAVAGVQPVDLAAAVELVRWAGVAGCRLVTIGGASKLHWTDPVDGDVLYMDMRLCARVVEYEPNDMTLTVESGITLEALSEVLAKQKQRVTLDPPGGARATIGGVLAANDSGPARFAYGTARDIVIGMSMIQPDGTVIKSGGKVVKNVAGYDLHKLYIGSFGAMGPIATVTLRLRPLPESRGAVMLEPEDGVDAERMIAHVLSGPTRPTFIELVNTRMAKALDVGSRTTLVFGFEENAEAVAWQCDQVTDALGGDRLTDRYTREVYDKLREGAGLPAVTSFKATMLSSDLAAFVDRFSAEPLRMIVRVGNGVVYGLPDEPLAQSTWREIEAATTASQGFLQIRGETPAFLPRFGRERDDGYLSDAIRSTFDARGMFAPERVG